jgi:hypothetical protein
LEAILAGSLAAEEIALLIANEDTPRGKAYEFLADNAPTERIISGGGSLFLQTLTIWVPLCKTSGVAWTNHACRAVGIF